MSSLVRARRTTVLTAFFRALESSKPARERLFTDPFAKVFLTPSLKMWAFLSVYPFFKWAVPRYINYFWPGAHTAIVARTRLIDVMTIRAIQDHGVNQVMILGSGFDTRAHRLQLRERVQFVEMDRPVTLEYKQQLLNKVRNKAPVHVDYVAMDFSYQQPQDCISNLMRADHYKTLFIWEGAVNNFTATMGKIMFDYFQGFPSGTRIIFTYVIKEVLEAPSRFHGAASIIRLLKKVKEPWNMGLDPAELPHFLAEYNMELLYDEGAEDFRRLYFGEKALQMRGYEFYRVAMAVVK